MTSLIDILLIALVLTNLRLLGSSRVLSCIRAVAAQALLLGLLPVLVHWPDWSGPVLLLAAVSTTIKAGLMPWLLRRAVREADVRPKVDPIIGYAPSVLVGVALLCASMHLSSRLPLPPLGVSRFVVPVALFTINAGLFLIISRRKALTQVLGYLAMENGIFTFGLAVAAQEMLLVELGILLDVFVAVFVMGIAIYHINREFDDINTDRLSVLKG